MGFCGSRPNVVDPAAAQRARELAKEIAADSNELDCAERLLLLGAGESGSGSSKVVTRCLLVGKAAFEEVLGPLKAIIEAHRQYKEVNDLIFEEEDEARSQQQQQKAEGEEGGASTDADGGRSSPEGEAGEAVPLDKLNKKLTRALKPRNSAHGELWLQRQERLAGLMRGHVLHIRARSSDSKSAIAARKKIAAAR